MLHFSLLALVLTHEFRACWIYISALDTVSLRCPDTGVAATPPAASLSFVFSRDPAEIPLPPALPTSTTAPPLSFSFRMQSQLSVWQYYLPLSPATISLPLPPPLVISLAPASPSPLLSSSIIPSFSLPLWPFVSFRSPLRFWSRPHCSNPPSPTTASIQPRCKERRRPTWWDCRSSTASKPDCLLG